MTVSARQASEDEARAQSDGSALDLPTTITGASDLPTTITGASVVLWACGEIGAWAATGFGNPNGAVLGRTLAAVAGPVVWVSVGGVAIVAVLTRRRVRPRGRVGAGGGGERCEGGGMGDE